VNAKPSLSIAAAALATAVALRPAAVSAQPHPAVHHGGAHVSVGVGIGFGWGYPVYGYPLYGYPYFYNPFWWGYPLWSYPAYPYPAYGYPYPYYSGADLRIQAQPREAEVYVDGYLVGTVDNFDGTFQRLQMPLGEHEVTLYSPTYRSLSQRMLFRPGQSYKMKTVMQPLGSGEQPEARPAPSPQAQEQRPPMEMRQGPPAGPPPPGPPSRGGEIRVEQFGTLSMRVQPGDAEVAIDGERWEAPGGERIVVQLSDGPHRIEVRKQGYVTYTSTVRVHGGETTTLNVSLPSGG
jgi:hypothetical protein